MGGGEEDAGWKRKVGWRDPSLIDQKKRRERFFAREWIPGKELQRSVFPINFLRGNHIH